MFCVNALEKFLQGDSVVVAQVGKCTKGNAVLSDFDSAYIYIQIESNIILSKPLLLSYLHKSSYDLMVQNFIKSLLLHNTKNHKFVVFSYDILVIKLY